jgi:hypothetical protein
MHEKDEAIQAAALDQQCRIVASPALSSRTAGHDQDQHFRPTKPTSWEARGYSDDGPTAATPQRLRSDDQS